MQKEVLFRGEREKERGKKRQFKVIVIAWEIIFDCQAFFLFSTALHEKTGREKYNYDRFKPSIKIY